MSPDACIAALDRALAISGEDVVLRRVVGGTSADAVNIEVTCRATVRAKASPPLAGDATQTEFDVVMSPSQIDRAQWPGGRPVSTARFQSDARIPRTSDLLFVQGRQRTITSVKPILMQDTLVHIDLTIGG